MSIILYITVFWLMSVQCLNIGFLRYIVGKMFEILPYFLSVLRC